MPEQYFIIGADAKEYGPVPLDTLILWIHERRIIGASRIRTENGSYAEASTFPELAAFFAPATFAQPVVASSPAAPVGVRADFRVWSVIGQAWDLVKSHWLVLGGMFLLQHVLCYIVWHVPKIGWLGWLAISGPIMVGIWRAILGMLAGRPPSAAMMFEGFDRFGDAFLAGLVRCSLIILGTICFIVPGIILAMMWCFTFPIIAETRVGFWEAMKMSASLTEGYRWRLFLLALAGIPVCALGLICLYVGVFISLAVMVTAFGLAYRFIKEQKQVTGLPA